MARALSVSFVGVRCPVTGIKLTHSSSTWSRHVHRFKVNSLTRLSESSERREAVQSTREAELGREVELVSTHRVYFLLARLSAAYGSYMHV